jgi:hypothetical protein
MMSGEIRTGEQTVMAFFKVLSSHLSGETEESQGKIIQDSQYPI